MPQLGPLELILILVAVVIVFGVGKLPEVGGAVGKSIKEFRRSSKEGEADEAAKDAVAPVAEKVAAAPSPVSSDSASKL